MHTQARQRGRDGAAPSHTLQHARRRGSGESKVTEVEVLDCADFQPTRIKIHDFFRDYKLCDGRAAGAGGAGACVPCVLPCARPAPFGVYLPAGWGRGRGGAEGRGGHVQSWAQCGPGCFMSRLICCCAHASQHPWSPLLPGPSPRSPCLPSPPAARDLPLAPARSPPSPIIRLFLLSSPLALPFPLLLFAGAAALPVYCTSSTCFLVLPSSPSEVPTGAPLPPPPCARSPSLV